MKACISLLLILMAAVFLVGPIAVVGGCSKGNKAEASVANSTSIVQQIINKEKK